MRWMTWRAISGRPDLAVNEAIRANLEPLAKLLTLEIGKVPSECAGELVVGRCRLKPVETCVESA
jgi:hypothetical protein